MHMLQHLQQLPGLHLLLGGSNIRLQAPFLESELNGGSYSSHWKPYSKDIDCPALCSQLGKISHCEKQFIWKLSREILEQTRAGSTAIATLFSSLFLDLCSWYSSFPDIGDTSYTRRHSNNAGWATQFPAQSFQFISNNVDSKKFWSHQGLLIEWRIAFTKNATYPCMQHILCAFKAINI